MASVNILQLQDDGTQVRVAHCVLVGENAQCEGESDIVSYLRSGVVGLESEEILFPKDGLRFLRALKFHFKSGYLNATDVE